MIKERLLALPNEIETLKKKILKLQEDIANIKELMNQWELVEIEEIANTVDDKGKPVFSNDTKRKAELERRKLNDERYDSWAKTLKQLEHEIAELNIALDKLYNEQSNLRAICRLEGASND